MSVVDITLFADSGMIEFSYLFQTWQCDSLNRLKVRKQLCVHFEKSEVGSYKTILRQSIWVTGLGTLVALKIL